MWQPGENSAEAGEVEVDGNGVTFRGIDLDGGGIGGEGFGREIEFESSAGHDARTMTPATVVCVAVKIGGGAEPAAVIDLNLEVSPEIIRARD